MKPRVGADVVDVRRLGRALERTPTLAGRLFTEAERRGGRLGEVFAAKEALAKALGAPAGLAWHDAEVDLTGRTIDLAGTVAGRARELGVGVADLSVRRVGPHALAVVVLDASRHLTPG